MDIRHLGEMPKLKGQELQDHIKSGKGAMKTYNPEAKGGGGGGGTRLEVGINALEEYYDFMD